MKDIIKLYTFTSPPKTDDPFKEYQEYLGKYYRLIEYEPPKEDGTWEDDSVGLCYFSLYTYHSWEDLQILLGENK